MDLCKRDLQGFTLLELLVAIAMTAVLTLAVYGTYRSVSSSAENYGKTIHDHEMVMICLERMSADLKSIAIRSQSEYAPSKDPKKNDPLMIRIRSAPSDAGTSDETPLLQLSSRESLPLSPSDLPGIVTIRYGKTQDENGGWVLRRSQSNLPCIKLPDMKTEPVVCRGLRSIEILAMDETGKTWENWDSNAKEQRYETPVSVLIRLRVGQGASQVSAETWVRLPVKRLSPKTAMDGKK